MPALAVLLHLAVALVQDTPADVPTPISAAAAVSAPAAPALAPLPAALRPPLAPLRDPGPFDGNEVVAAAAGSLLGDALVIGAGYGTLQMFANGAIQPTAAHFRHAAYAFGASALLVPPLTAVLLARWARADPASGSVWKALVLATLGQAVALGAGYVAAPQIWVVLPVQIVTVAVGTTVGLHWGPRPRSARPADPGTEARSTPAPPAPAGRGSALLAPPICPAA